GELDLWARIRSGFSLPELDNPRIDAQLDWYARHQGYLDRVATRATPYLYFIVEEIDRRGIPMEIALLPIVESAFDPFAYSHGRAAGLWQFIPGTGKRFDMKQNWWYDGRRDVYAATMGALDYLEYLHRHFDGNWLHAVAAYNSGEGNVGRAIRYNERRDRPTDFWNLRLPRETAAYVPKLLALQKLVANPERYGVTLQPIANEPVLARVDVGRQVDLALVAQLAGMETEEIYLLNPGFNRWATDPDGPHELFVPLDRVEQLEQGLAELGPGDTIQWRRHYIRPGENLGSIANRYDTTVELLREVNSIRGNVIRAGDTLTVPVAMKSLDRYSLTADNRLESKQNVARAKHKIEHRVASGESFWSISHKYEVGIRELAKWNGMAPRDPLRAGQTLVVWTDERPSFSQAVGLTPEARLRSITYTVRRGDSLARIASRFGVSVGEIARWNELDMNDYLQPGQRLRLKVDVTKQST
ncbi:MAG: LysM peptidoglycan-binding domain-containing protein, partial [Gammaproteobacteria bacterium]|nr:LysM peptidoglycan-binding domain-containing protein [Gammaproteobacteria bacterium]